MCCTLPVIFFNERIHYLHLDPASQCVCIVTRRDVQLSDIIVLWQSGVNVIFIPLSDVTNSEHKLRQFSISQTMYSNDPAFKDLFAFFYLALVIKFASCVHIYLQISLLRSGEYKWGLFKGSIISFSLV